VVGGLDGRCSGRTDTRRVLEEARENLIDAVKMIREPVNLSKLPQTKVIIEQLEV
jgi:hypothetical protein